MKVKIARLFSGFDGAGEGMKNAGFDLGWSIEKDNRIAEVARMNGHDVITADVLEIDPRTLEPVYGIHASPPCTNASQANQNAEVNEDGTKETRHDILLANKIIEFLEVLKPRVFTLENVWMYRKFQSFFGGEKCEGILHALSRLGYKTGFWHINAADYGVPQTRKRLILVASLDFVPEKPWETHHDPAKPEIASSLFSSRRKPWISWYEAIEDLLPILPESKFAPWQIERLPEEIKMSILVNTREQHNSRDLQLTVVDKSLPAYTIPASSNSARHKAFLVHSTDIRTMPVVSAQCPSFTVIANQNFSRAFIVDGQNARPSGIPCYCIENEPMMTITASSAKGSTRAWIQSGKVVKMTPRALARFQTFSDEYSLPENITLSCKGIGNACPPLLFEKIYSHIKTQGNNHVQNKRTSQ